MQQQLNLKITKLNKIREKSEINNKDPDVLHKETKEHLLLQNQPISNSHSPNQVQVKVTATANQLLNNRVSRQFMTQFVLISKSGH